MRQVEKIHIRIPKGGLNARHFAKFERMLTEDQDQVMLNYKSRGFVTTKEEEQALHMFFSPTRVPKGLTLKMVRECINNYPLRKWCCDEYLRLNGKRIRVGKVGNLFLPPLPDEAFVKATTLPKELLPGRGRMTYKRFNEGMREFKAWAANLVIIWQNRPELKPLGLSNKEPNA